MAAPIIINFSGYEWIVKESRGRKVPPGPNYYSSSETSVSIDNEGRLHLSLRKEDGKWLCSEIITRQKLGYGLYSFRISGGLEDLSPQAVLGLFTYDQKDPPYYQELDIEFSRWGKIENSILNYTVQPYTIHENNIKKDLNPSGITEHTILWNENVVVFSSWLLSEKSGEKTLIHRWEYSGQYIPIPKKPAFRMNLWLFQGKTPEKETEIIVDDFSYIPEYR